MPMPAGCCRSANSVQSQLSSVQSQLSSVQSQLRTLYRVQKGAVESGPRCRPCTVRARCRRCGIGLSPPHKSRRTAMVAFRMREAKSSSRRRALERLIAAVVRCKYTVRTAVLD
eukprot:COSAG01_NODE_2298_length_7966_cov_53.072455_2_plen_114_part_00